MHVKIHTGIARIAHFFDAIQNKFESDHSHRFIGSLIVLSFFLSLVLIFFKNMEWLPDSIGIYIPTNYFSAIVSSFLVLLAFEILSLIFVLPESVSSSLVKQFEIFSLILLRDIFKRINTLPSNFDWAHMNEHLFQMGAEAIGALSVFIGIFFIRRLQLHKKITEDTKKQNQFVEIKKIISLVLALLFIFLLVQDSYLFFTHAEYFKLFKTFYTFLIFADILLVLIALRYNYSYTILFRNSGFAIATIMLRFALSAPSYYGALIGISSVIFVIILTFFYSKYRVLEE